MTAMDKRLNALQPGESIEISRTETGWCTAERSGDGATLRFVRHTATGWTIFKTCNW